jgi:DNA-binding XRE family transcriptional regulator
MLPLDRSRRAAAFMVRVHKITVWTWIHCNFFTKPKIKLTVQRPRILRDGYPTRPKTLGERLKKKRMDMGLFQKDVARVIGVSTDTITNWEKGRTKSSKNNLERIIRFLAVKT